MSNTLTKEQLTDKLIKAGWYGKSSQKDIAKNSADVYAVYKSLTENGLHNHWLDYDFVVSRSQANGADVHEDTLKIFISALELVGVAEHKDLAEIHGDGIDWYIRSVNAGDKNGE